MVCDMIFIYPLLDFSIHVVGSTPLLLLHYLIEKKTGDSTHRRTCRWGWGLQHDKGGQALTCSGERFCDSEAPDIRFICSMVGCGIHAYIL